MRFMEAGKSGFRNYFSFSGRASRSEYWFFVLFLLLTYVLVGIVESVIFGQTTSTEVMSTANSSGTAVERVGVSAEYEMGPLVILWGAAVFIPLVSAGWRRLQDRGRPGWYLTLPFIITIITFYAVFTYSGISLVGNSDSNTGAVLVWIMKGNGVWPILLAEAVSVVSFVTLFVWLCLKSQHGPNRYGPNPHEVQS
jgi:uncharacterized membrane protein YhaH (DUF805 family)